MKKALITLLLVLGALAYTAAPAISMPSQESIQLQEKKKDAKKKTQTVTFRTSMHCKNCEKKITDNISFEKGVKDLKTSLEDKLVTITYVPSKTDEAALEEALEKLGYTVEKIEQKQ